jgi:zinc protease
MTKQPTDQHVLEKILTSGLTVLVMEDHSSPVVAVQIWFKVGSVNETEENTGLAHFLEHMVFKGTEKHGVGEIANLIKAAGGNLNASTSYSYTMYYVVLPSRDFSLGLSVQADAMMHSSFAQKEFEKERIVVIDEARMYDDQPEAYTFYRTMELGFQVHNYRRPIAGYEHIVEKIERDQLLDFYGTYYRPANAVLVVVGDIEAETALEEIQEVYGGWKPGPVRANESPVEPEQQAFRFKMFRGSIDHAYAGVGFHIPSIVHEDYPALEVLSTLLGHGKSSRLYADVFEKKHLVTSASASVLAEKWPGFFQIYASMPEEKCFPALSGIFEELQRLRTGVVEESELIKVKRQLQKSNYGELETMEGQAANLGYYQLLGDYRMADEHQEAIGKVTAVQVAAAAHKYLTLANCSVVAYLPEDATVSVPASADLEAALGRSLGPEAAAPAAIDTTRTTGRKADRRSRAATKSRVGSEKPPLELIELDNGLRILLKARPSIPLVSMVTLFHGGVSMEPAGQAGLSLLTQRLLLKGSRGYSVEEIARTVEEFGGGIESYSSYDTCGVAVSILAPFLESVRPVLGDVIKRPLFEATAVDHEKNNLLEKLAERNDNPVSYSIDRLFQYLYGTHPYANPNLGEAEQVKSLAANDCLGMFQRVLVPENMVLCLVGDITKERAVQLAGELYGDLKRSPRPVPAASTPRRPDQPGLHLLTRPNIKQSVALVGYLAPPMMSREAIALEVLNGVLAGLGGRLFVELRDKRSLGYMTGSSLLPLKEGSIFFGYANPKAEGVDEAVEVITRELEKVAGQLVEEKELARAKQWMLGSQVMRLQRNMAQAFAYGTNEVLGFGYDVVDRLPDIIRAVSREEIREAAAGVFKRDAAVIVKLQPNSSPPVDDRSSSPPVDLVGI